MVEVRHQSKKEIQDWAGRMIPRLVSIWEELPARYQELDGLDVGEVHDYVEEWPLYEMFRLQLEDASREGMLTEEQESAMDHLRALVEKRGALVDELLGQERP